MGRCLLALGLFLYTSATRADLFYYKDETGTLNAVDSPSLIPQKYRAVTRAINSSELSASEIDVPLERDGDSLIVSVSFGGLQAWMVLDTGASSTMISHSLANRLSLKSIGESQIITASHTIKVQNVIVPEISVRSFSVKNMRVTVHDLPGEGRKEGLLGTDFFDQFRMELDTQKGILRLRKK